MRILRILMLALCLLFALTAAVFADIAPGGSAGSVLQVVPFIIIVAVAAFFINNKKK